MTAVGALVGLLLLAGGEMPPIEPGQVEGRPSPEDASPLQAMLDALPPGATLEVPAGEYRGDLVIERPARLVGRGRPRLVGSGRGSVVRVRAPDVTVEGFDIDGLGGGDLGADTAGVHVAAPRATVRDCRIVNTLFGVYLREALGARVEGNFIRGIAGKDPGEKGSGIHLWATDGFTVTGNTIVDVRDGMYVQSSSHGLVRGNSASDLRYGLHYMFSDDNVFEDNLFERSAAGAVLMYSSHITFRRNRLLHNRGFASVGILMKDCNDSVAEDNLVADNARGIFLDNSFRDVVRRNLVAESDVAIVLYASCGGVVFEGNSFVSNLSPLQLVGRRTDTRFDGNYWSDDAEPDLDGDGRSDRPYRLVSLFDHLRENLTAADLLAQSPAASALAAAERAFPVLRTVEAVDRAPLRRPPPLEAVPQSGARPHGVSGWGLGASLALVAVGASLLRSHRGAGRRE